MPTITTTTAALPHLRMIRVEGGSFLRASQEVTVSTFELAQYPVTQALWEAVMGEGSNPSRFQGPRRPVEGVSWYHAVAFCNRLSHLEGRLLCYFSDKKYSKPFALQGDLPNEGPVYFRPTPGAYRLPTEAEWEYAARGGRYGEGYEYAGSDRLWDVAWYRDNSSRETQPVGLLQPNALGLYEMSGNVWEWCWDWYGDYPDVAVDDPLGPATGEYKVLRGGSWYISLAALLRVAYRDWVSPDLRYYIRGFRLARHP